jgi:hypothetical protein
MARCKSPCRFDSCSLLHLNIRKVEKLNFCIIDLAKDEDFIHNNKNLLLELWSRFNLKTNFRNELAKSSVLPEKIYNDLTKSKSDDIIRALHPKKQMEII